ncbi:MAG TPA: metallophosphoesterase [Polyangiaceae bacterium]|jgi:3',5'-cyclic AMP phosphodiesterase CpdA
MRIAHFSDLHLLALEGVPARRFLNKRLTGWANLRLKRGSIHRAAYVRAIAREIARLDMEHVVVTGDLTNLALESEFELVRTVFDQELGLDPSRVTVVPGNHDLYTRGSLTSRRFERYLAPYLESDLPELAVDVGGARFPIVKLRGDVAMVALTSAVPRAPLVAAGELGRAQIAALARVLAHAEVARRTVVIALHHPAVHRWSRLKTHLEGLRDAPALVAELRSLSRGLVLHGHLHRRIQRALVTDAGQMLQVGATSASLHHDEADRMAGFNVYDVSAAGVPRVEAVVFDPGSGSFRVESVPKHV